MLKIDLALATGWNDVRTLARLTITNDGTGTEKGGRRD